MTRRWGRPFPWLLLAWPVLALYGLLWEVFHRVELPASPEPIYIGTEPARNVIQLHDYRGREHG